MYSVAFFTFMLVAFASATSSQQQEQAPNSPPDHHVAPIVNQPQNGPVVEVGPVHQQPSVVGGAPVEVSQPQHVEHHHFEHQHQQAPHPAMLSYYSPSGLMTVVGDQQQAGNNKPAPVRYTEQYGQPESAALPANYKPFGSWGLYIGGNPADGYYTNYYKALGASVEKQQVGDAAKPVGGQTSALSPLLRQAGSSPYGGGEYYPFAYSPSDLNSGARPMAVEPVHSVPAHSQVGPVQSAVPVQVGPQVYGQPDQSYGVSPYADAYATKRVGAAFQQKEATKDLPQVSQQQQQHQQAPKGYNYNRVYYYPSPVAPMLQPSAQPAVFAYPVPVGSQIVGSQQGVSGEFNPHGVYAFTRYAMKPTVASHEANHYYNVHGSPQ